MEKIDVMTEINIALEGKKFLQRDFLNALDFANKKRVKRLWSVLRNQNIVVKNSNKKFELVNINKKSAAA